MESIEAKIIYTTYAKVVKIEEKFAREYQGGIGNEAKFREISKGWFLHMTGSYEAIRIGTSRPPLKTGDKIKITIQKEQDAETQPTSIQ